MGKELSPDVLHYFANKAFSVVEEWPTPVRWLFESAYNAWTRALNRANPLEMSKEIESFASASNIDPLDVQRAIILPDTAAFLNRFSDNPLPHELPSAGCTSVARHFTDGSFVYGRNLDFAGVNNWDRHPLVTVFLPEAGSHELKHVSFGADGVLWSGITGVNEAGISFAIHQNFTRDSSLGGVPMFLIGEILLRQAHTLQEATELLQKYRPGPLWTFIISDLNKGEILAIESSKRNFSVRAMTKNIFAQTNHLLSPQLRSFENISLGNQMNSADRLERAEKLLSDISEKTARPEFLARILSFVHDESGDLSSYQDILKAETIQTVILTKNPTGSLSAAISEDAAPTSSGRYVAFPLSNLWLDNGNIPFTVQDYAHTQQTVREKQIHSATAFALYFDQNKLTEARFLLSDQESLDATLFKSITLIVEKNYEQALQLIDRQLHSPLFSAEPLYIQQSLHFIRLLALSERGQKAATVTAAQELLHGNILNEHIRQLTEKLAQGKELSSDQKEVFFDFFSGDISTSKN
jgi:hypothetical protein